MLDALQLLWPALEATRPVFSRAAVARWPKGAREALEAARLIQCDGTTDRIRCPECGDIHDEEPAVRAQPDETARVFITCPEHLRAEVAALDRELWSVNVEAFVAAVAASLSLTGRPQNLDSGRIWRCGRTDYQGKLRDVLFARGLRRKDAEGLRRSITSAHWPIVVVPSEIPDVEFWRGRVPPVVRLCEVATFVDEHVEMDGVQFMGLVRMAEIGADVGAILTIDQLKPLIRHQVKAEGKSSLKDDWLLSAYRIHGSYRKAAEFLTEESGRTVTKDQVSRAVKRSGGINHVFRDTDSESVERLRTSRRRDMPYEKRD